MPEISPKAISMTTRWLIQLFLRVYLLILAPITFFQRSLIYHPTRCERLLASDFQLLQRSVDQVVQSRDGLKLNGWLTLAGVPRGSDPIDAKQVLAEGRPVILFFPGNAGNRSMRAAQFDVMGSLDAHMLLVDYRGYADNPGKPSEADFARDARSVWNHLTTELDVPPHRVVIYGESLGGGVATRLASDLCQAGIEPGGLIVQSTFSSLVAVAQEHFPIVPVSLLLVDRFPSDQRIKNVTCPVLQIHGQQDSIVSFAIGERLFEAAPSRSSGGILKHQIVMPHTDHNDVYAWSVDREKLIDGLRDFLEQVARQPEPESSPVDRSNRSPVQSEGAGDMTFSIDWTIVGSGLLVALAVILWWISRGKPPIQQS
jgi:pimeloyl-ACP methyl ester carboxylesterase